MNHRFFLVIALLSCIAYTTAETRPLRTLYAVHDNHVVALQGQAFIAHDNSAYHYDHDTGKILEIKIAKDAAPSIHEVATAIDSAPVSSRASEAISSHTEKRCYHDNGGDVYLFLSRNGDTAPKATVQNLPPGYRILLCSAVPYEGKILLLLRNTDTGDCLLSFLHIDTGMLSEERYPLADELYKHALIWRGGNLVWLLSVGRRNTAYHAYDLNRREYVLEDIHPSAFSMIAPIGGDLYILKYDGDPERIDSAIDKLPADDAPQPVQAAFYSIPEQAGHTILRSEGRAYLAHENKAYATILNYVYEYTIAPNNRTQKIKVHDYPEDLPALPGCHHDIRHHLTGNIGIHGGDIYLPSATTATPIHVRNIPAGYVIDACTTTPHEGKLALHLTHKEEGKSAFALLNIDQCTIDGPLHEAPTSAPAALIWRGGDLVWEVEQGKAWELPLKSYSLSLRRYSFSTILDLPRAIFILQGLVGYLDSDGQLKTIYPPDSKS